MIEVRKMDTTPVVGPWQLPKGWEWISLKDIIRLEYGKALPTRARSEGPYPVFGSGGQVGTHASALTNAPAIIIGRKGSIGSVFFSGESCWPIDTTYYIDQFASFVNPKYIYFFLKILPLSINRASAIPGLNRDDVYTFSAPIPFPNNHDRSLDIQHRIVDRIEALLADLREAQNSLESMYQDIDQVIESALLEIFAHTRDGFKVVNVPPEEIKAITNVAQIERGKFTPRPRNDPRFFGGSIPWVQIQNLPKDKGEKYITSYMNTLNDLGLSVSRLFPKGTIVLSIAATIGAVGILTFDACFPDSLVGITPDSDFIDSGFLYWQLVFLQEYLEQIAPSAAQKNINLKILEQIELWVPSPTTQALINAHLDAIQEGIAHLYEMTEEDKEILHQVEQSILERAFRGEL